MKLLLMGLGRCGKTSILSVVFEGISANETLFFDATIHPRTVEAMLDFCIVDTPSESNDPDMIQTIIAAGSTRENLHSAMNKSTQIAANPSNNASLRTELASLSRIQSDILKPKSSNPTISNAAIIFVIDGQEEYTLALERLKEITFKHPDIPIEVFIHKVDGLSADMQIDIQRNIHARLNLMITDANSTRQSVTNISFYLTSIYDTSIHESFSKVVQKYLPTLPMLENALNTLCSNSGIEKVFLVDCKSKIYLATDSSPVDVQSYSLCSDSLCAINETSQIYTGGTDLNHVSNGSEAGTAELDEYARESIIRLGNGMVIYSRYLSSIPDVALVCMVRKDRFDLFGIVEYNVGVIADCIKQILVT